MSDDATVVRTVLRMRTRKGSESAFEAAWAEAAAAISKLPGSVRQDLVRDTEDPRTYLIISDWTDRARLDAFGRSRQREQLMAAIRDLRESAERNTYELRYSVAGRAGRCVHEQP
jgi:quinol monooxygenase YgiN